MHIELKVPEIGESVTEVELGDWLKNEGEAVRKDDPLVSLESQKATIELPSPAAGTLARITKHKGETAAIGEVIGLLETGAEAGADKPEIKRPEAPAKPEALRTAAGVASVPPRSPVAHSQVMAQASAPGDSGSQRAAGPATAGRDEEVVPMSRLRRTAAERLVEGQQNAALVTTFNEVDMSGVMGLRREFGDAFQKERGVRLGFMSFFVKASVEALKQFPALNAEIRGTSIVYHNYYDIGIAVGTPRGLVVPVLRNAERMSFAEIEKAISDFGHRSKENRLKVDELQGGTFTITNGGIYGSMLSTPLLNPPQSGVLGMHAIQDRPVVRDGQVVIRPIMYLALTYDHRIVDGQEAVSFLKRARELIETPSRILLEI